MMLNMYLKFKLFKHQTTGFEKYIIVSQQYNFTNNTLNEHPEKGSFNCQTRSFCCTYQFGVIPS